MERRSSVHRVVFQNAFRAVAKVLRVARRAGLVAALCLAVLVLGVVCLTEVYAAFGTPGRAQATAASSTLTFTTFDVPAAGTSAFQGTFGTSINDGGDIAGIYLTTPNVNVPNLAHGFVRAASNGAITTFDAPNAGTGKNQGTFPASINTGGDIAGTYFDANNAYHGFVRVAAGTITEFDVPGAPTSTGHRGTVPLNVNTGGDITGFYVDGSDVRHGFVRAANGTITAPIDAPGAGSGGTEGTVPFGIDTAGDITGFYKDSGGTFHGFLRAANATITAINAPGAGTGPSGKVSFMGTLPVRFDAAGDIGGTYADASSVNHGFVRSAAGTITGFDVPGVGTTGMFPGTIALGMNAGGDISGIYTDTTGVRHGFLRSAGGTFTNPIDAPNASTTGMFSGTILISINTTGEMTGTFADANNVFHGFLLAPPQAPTPTVTSLNPTSGPVGTSVTITGTNFGATQGTSTVTFNGTMATPTSWSATSIVVPVPAGATTGNVVVTVGGVASNDVAFTVTPSGTFTVNGGTVLVAAGMSQMATITVTPAGGFTGQVMVSCPAPGLPPGVTCPNSPLTVTVPSGGGNGTRQLTVAVAAPAAMNATASVMPVERKVYAAGIIATRGGKGWWMLSAGTGLVAILLLLVPGKRRYRAALGLGLACALSFTLGCNGNGGGGGGGPVPTTTHIVVTSATKAAAGGTFTFTATVNGGTPTDQVQLLDNGTPTGNPVAVAGGTAMLTTAALNTVGTHSITAHYAGDATNTQASSSGALNVTVTGNTTITIQTTPAASNGSPTVSVTIN